MQVHQVVTGHDAKGRAVFVRDEQVDGMPIPGLGEFVFLWSADEPATYPNAGDNPAAPGIYPPVGGIRFLMGTYSPEFDVVAPEPTPETNPASTGPTRRISGSLSPATWYSSLTMARRCCFLPAMFWWRTELATVGGWLGTCRPPWLLCSSEPTAFRTRPDPRRPVRRDRGRPARHPLDPRQADAALPDFLRS
jgi:hypothetical protein